MAMSKSRVLKMDNKPSCPNCGANNNDCLSEGETHLLEKISLRNLLRGRRELIIEHNDEDYCLRRTNRNRLILTKMKLSLIFSGMMLGLAEI